MKRSMMISVGLVAMLSMPVSAAIIHVPDDYSTMATPGKMTYFHIIGRK